MKVESGRRLKTVLIQGNGMLSKSLSISCGPEHGKINVNGYIGPSIYVVPANDLDVTSAVPQKKNGKVSRLRQGILLNL